MSSEELRVSEPMLFFIFVPIPTLRNTIPTIAMCAPLFSANLCCDWLTIFQTVRSCRQINVGSERRLGHFLFCGHNTTPFGLAAAGSLPILSLSSPSSLITPRFHFNDFLVALGGPVNHPTESAEWSSPQNKATSSLKCSDTIVSNIVAIDATYPQPVDILLNHSFLYDQICPEMTFYKSGNHCRSRTDGKDAFGSQL